MEKKLISPQVIVAVILLAVALAGLFFFFPDNKPSENNDASQCTLEAKLCPDGSAVGREGPNCEFPDCPDNSPAKND